MTVGREGTVECTNGYDDEVPIKVGFSEEIDDKFYWYYQETELELVEEEAYVKNDVEQTKDLVIEKVEIELKNKQSRIDYLEGQISVYEKFIFNKEEN